MRIQIRSCDDWVAVYKDGKRVYSNHSCPLAQGLEALGITFEAIDVDDQLDDLGNMKDGSEPFPEDLTVDDPPCTGSGYAHAPHGRCRGWSTDRT